MLRLPSGKCNDYPRLSGIPGDRGMSLSILRQVTIETSDPRTLRRLTFRRIDELIASTEGQSNMESIPR